MAKGYWIGRVDVSNDEGYKPHAPANLAIFKKFGGRFARRQVHRRRRPKPRAQRGDRIRQLHAKPTSRSGSRTRSPISSSSRAVRMFPTGLPDSDASSERRPAGHMFPNPHFCPQLGIASHPTITQTCRHRTVPIVESHFDRDGIEPTQNTNPDVHDGPQADPPRGRLCVKE